MGLVISICIVVLGCLLEIVLALYKGTTAAKILLAGAIGCALLIVNVIRYRRSQEEKKERVKREKYMDNIAEKTLLVITGLSPGYVDGLGESPHLKHNFHEGQRLEEESKYEAAIGKYTECLNHPSATFENTAAINMLISRCYLILGNSENAREFANAALAISKHIKNQREKAVARGGAYVLLANSLRKQGKRTRAIKHTEKALKIFGRINENLSVGICYSNLAGMEIEAGRDEKAYILLQKAYAIAEQENDKALSLPILANISVLRARKGGGRETIENWLELIKEHEARGEFIALAAALNNLGNVYREGGDFDKAIECYARALEIRRRGEDTAAIARVEYNLGMARYGKKDIEGAMELLENAEKRYARAGRRTEATEVGMEIERIRKARGLK